MSALRRTVNMLLIGVVVATAAYGLWVVFWPMVVQAQRYQRLLAAPPPAAHTLPNPLPGRSLTDTWGSARSEGRRHEGIDIFAPRSTPILATTQGVVLRLGPDRLGGRTVMILGPAGYRHYYAHLQRYPNLKRGDWVKVGEVVGYVGSSGNAINTPPHLHYGIYTAQGAINPYPLLGP